MSQRARELDSLRYYYSDAVVEPVMEMPIGALKGAIVSYSAHEHHYQFREWWAIALLDGGSFVQIVYYAPAMDAASPGRLRKILASVAPGDEASPQPAGAGFTRHRAGRIALDVPERLTPQSNFSFASGDLKVTLDLSIFPRPTIWTLPAGEVSERRFESVTVDRIPATIQSLVATNLAAGENEPRQYMHGEVRFDDEVTAHVDGRATAELSIKLNETFRELFRSIQREE
jgi:hypothetical protein